ncbi:MAG TPA: phosphodiesterase [Terriglobales bacterium]|nr:phosphodiesterase [Terriglobales bacterium]
MLIAQLSDTHIKGEGVLAYGRYDTSAFLARAVDHLLRLEPRPDVVLATGDLVDGGTPAEYARLRHLLAPLPMPVYLIPGNHDDRDALRLAFPDHAYLPREGFIQYVVDDGPLRLIALDTLIPGKAGGEVDDARVRWLDARLAEAPAKPTVVFMHHPPFETGIDFMDGVGLAGADRLAEVVRRHPHVERVLCGHLHRTIQTRWAGTVAMTVPSTAHQVALDLREDVGLSLSLEPPGYALHLWKPGGGLVSHVATVGEFTTYTVTPRRSAYGKA